MANQCPTDATNGPSMIPPLGHHWAIIGPSLGNQWGNGPSLGHQWGKQWQSMVIQWGQWAIIGQTMGQTMAINGKQWGKQWQSMVIQCGRGQYPQEA